MLRILLLSLSLQASRRFREVAVDFSNALGLRTDAGGSACGIPARTQGDALHPAGEPSERAGEPPRHAGEGLFPCRGARDPAQRSPRDHAGEPSTHAAEGTGPRSGVPHARCGTAPTAQQSSTPHAAEHSPHRQAPPGLVAAAAPARAEGAGDTRVATRAAACRVAGRRDGHSLTPEIPRVHLRNGCC